MNNAPLSRKVTVSNPLGLHMRPARLLVNVASKYTSNIQIGTNGDLFDCKSILSLMTLGAAQGTELSLTAEGSDAAEALQSISDLFDAGFDEKDETQKP